MGLISKRNPGTGQMKLPSGGNTEDTGRKRKENRNVSLAGRYGRGIIVDRAVAKYR